MVSISPIQGVLALSTLWVLKIFGRNAEILWINPFRMLAIVSGPFFPAQGKVGHYYAKFSAFAKFGTTCLSSVVFWDAIPTFWISDADAIRIVSADRQTFTKDVEAYEILNIYGQNLVGTEGAVWKRHRAVAKSAFNEANNAFVWTESMRIATEWFSDIDNRMYGTARECTVDLLKDLTQLTLLIISTTGFGRRVSWSEDAAAVPPPGHKIAFRPAVTSAISHLIPKMLTPDLIYNLSDWVYLPFISSALKETTESFEALKFHMLDVISLARARVTNGKAADMDAALLRNLVEANMFEEADCGYKRLTDDELLSNTMTFLLAGHETTAHTICFAVVLLALYPDVQRRVYEEVSKFWPEGAPAPESIAALEYTTGVFLETLRLFPPVARLGKLVQANSVIPARRFQMSPEGRPSDVEQFSVAIDKGSLVIIDIFGLHMNPIHWGEDVEEFRPERFIDTKSYRWPRDAFFAFAGGPRSCIGQRFAITEGLCLIANIVRNYEILVPYDLCDKGVEEQRKILLHWSPSITILPTEARALFRRRK
ncbi:cytochrome P450 [Guyanagaster necrorhizus]|uniref:Cytochrome P450 n=1 Tax=Guyanagaster necrorhizus TaxID=856835 RepID=A0A9P7VYS3_9AGAR|nr:cytochrome P450 [Guyanagaster necrorhizus MCA 3950]KAG7448724.1 cytochrome P450 [Guyanagaster necrorhizus MCA 3950]